MMWLPGARARLRRSDEAVACMKASWRGAGGLLGCGGPARRPARRGGARRRIRASQRRTVDADGDAVMLQAVEERIDQGLFLEQLVPLGQIEIGGDDGGDAVVALVHEAEEGVGLLRLEGEIADLVDDQGLQLAQALEQPCGVEQRLGIVEAAAVAVEA